MSQKKVGVSVDIDEDETIETLSNRTRQQIISRETIVNTSSTIGNTDVRGNLTTSDVTGPNGTLNSNLSSKPIVISNDPNSRNKGINKFVAHLTQKDLARPAHFRFKIARFGNDKNIINALNDVNFLCDTTVFPDIALNPVVGEVKYNFPYEIVNNVTHGTFSASFLCERSMVQRKFFEDWISIIYSHKKGQASYYDDYTTSVEVFQLKHNFLDHLPDITTDTDWTYKVKLNNVYPKSFTSQSLDWSAGNKYHTMNVTFHFTDYTYHANKRAVDF